MTGSNFRAYQSLALAVAVVVGGAFWLRSRLGREKRDFVAFCRATKAGESWESVEGRATAKGYESARANPLGRATVEYLVTTDIAGAKVGCRVTLKGNHVTETADFDLP
jgi:hypothetical protein